MQRLRGRVSSALLAVLLAAVSIAASFSAALTAEAAEYTVENSGYAYEGSTESRALFRERKSGILL